MKKAEEAVEKAAKGKTSKGFTDEERAAMKERAAELKTETGRSARGKKKVDGESDLLAKIADMQEPDRTIATRIHEIVKASAPDLTSKTWYGMPAYANADGKIICFFQPAKKFNTRYATLGFNEDAHLDDGNVFPVAYAVKELTPREEAKIAALVKQAVS